jgi:hypothetical protein
LRKGDSGVGRHDSYGQRHNQAADDQGRSSGKVQRCPKVFPIEERYRLMVKGFLQFLPLLNNPWNLATARRRAAPGGHLLR